MFIAEGISASMDSSKSVLRKMPAIAISISMHHRDKTAQKAADAISMPLLLLP